MTRDTTRWSRLLLVSLALLGSAARPAQAGLANSVWPMFQHDPQHSGRATVNGPQGPNPDVAWYFRGDSSFRAAVSIGEDGTIYGGSGRHPMVAIDPVLGTLLWTSDGGLGKHNGALGDRSQPAVSETGVISMGARDNDLWSVNPDGSVNCRFHVPYDGDVTTSPTIAQDDTIYMGSHALGQGWFYAMNPDCSVKWFVIPLGGSLKNVSPALNLDESKVYVSLKDEAVALNTSDGSEAWRVTLADKGFGSRRPNFTPVLANDGSAIYFNSKEGLWALDPDTGDDLWLWTPPGEQELKSAPAIGADGTLYIGASRKKTSTFYALDPSDGSVVWSHTHGSDEKGRYENSQAAIGADGTVYVGFGHTVYAFEGDGNGSGGSAIKWQLELPGKFEAGPTIGGPGILYISTGKLLFKITD